MTVLSTNIRSSYVGPGAGPFAFSFRLIAGTDLEVTLFQAATGAVIRLNWITDFTFAANSIGNRLGGSITLNTALAAGDKIVLRRAPATLQLTDVANQGEQYPSTLEAAFDYAMMVNQRQDDDLGRSLQVPVSADPSLFESIISSFLPNYYLRVRSDGLGVEGVTNVIADPGFIQSGAGAVLRTANAKMAEQVSVKDFGAVGDGVTDDTLAFQEAYNSLSAVFGGEIFVPPGIYKMNLTIIKSGVTLRGVGGMGGFGKATCFSYLVPSDTTIPVLTIGNGTTLCDGFKLRNISIQGPVGAHYGMRIGGAINCSYEDFCIQGFDTYGIYITSSATQATAYQFFSHFAVNTRNGASAVGIDLLYGGSFTAAIYFANGAVQTGNTALAAMRNDGCVIRLANMWVQVGVSGAGLNSKNVGKFYMNGVQIDSNLSTDVLLTIDVDTVVSDRFIGNFNCDGVMATSGGNTAGLTGTSNYLANEPFLLYPYIQGAMYFTDSSLAPHAWHNVADQTVGIQRAGTQLRFTGDIRFMNTTKLAFFGVGPQAQIAAPAAPNNQTGAYVQADVQSIVTAVNAILALLHNYGLST